jgi:hypothetical protein
MKHDPRPHIRRRSHAIDRLRSLTTGAAVAGLAGTAGFGLLAAASWSGTANAADNAAGATTTTDGTYGTYGTIGAGGTSRSGRATPAPNTLGSAQQPTITAPRVQRVTGSGHASTGGSH